jgi:ATP-grasp domain, R2K clade family 3
MMEPILLVRRELMSNYEYQFATKHFRVEESRVLCRDSLVFGRYSVLPHYAELERDLALLGSRLINTFEQHRWIVSFDYYQRLAEFTPETWDESNIHQSQFTGPFVVKGKMKSRKWQWKSLMFARSKREALRIGDRLKEDSEIGEQGIVYRRFVPLKTFGQGKDGLPQTNEWRFFYLGPRRLSHAYYWPGSNFLDRATISDTAIALADRIAQIVSEVVPFFVLDLAETETGDWILIEVNDGQQSVPSEHDLDRLYGNLRAALTC